MLLTRLPRGRYIGALAILLAIAVVLSGIGAHYPHDWWLENGLVLGFIGFLAASYRRLPLSRVSYTLIFLFLCLHEVGAHWTYSEVPYDDWTRALFGTSLNDALGWQRNHFDRLVHFSYGLLLAYPIREVFVRVAEARGFWAYFLPLDVAMSTSMIYELIEWMAAEFFGGELGAAYLGTQGDIWDAHKDMLLATIGAATAMAITAALNVRFQRDFAREFVDSLRVKGRDPLGEDEIERMKRS
jgi:putative membrane protein